MKVKFALLFAAFVATSRASPTQRCRCAPGEACWPTSSELDALSAKLSSPDALLRQINPPDFACHDPAYNATACDYATNEASDLTWRTAQPGGTVNPLFESQAAFSFNVTASLQCSSGTEQEACGQGQVPSLGVAAANENDIVAALTFARERNLQVMVKGTG